MGSENPTGADNQQETARSSSSSIRLGAWASSTAKAASRSRCIAIRIRAYSAGWSACSPRSSTSTNIEECIELCSRSSVAASVRSRIGATTTIASSVLTLLGRRARGDLVADVLPFFEEHPAGQGSRLPTLRRHRRGMRGRSICEPMASRGSCVHLRRNERASSDHRTIDEVLQDPQRLHARHHGITSGRPVKIQSDPHRRHEESGRNDPGHAWQTCGVTIMPKVAKFLVG